MERQSIGIGEKRTYTPSLSRQVGLGNISIIRSTDLPAFVPKPMVFPYTASYNIFKMVHDVLHSLLNLLTNKDTNNSPLNAVQSPPTQFAPLNALPNLLKKTTSLQTKKPISGKHSACLRCSIQIIRMQKKEY